MVSLTVTMNVQGIQCICGLSVPVKAGDNGYPPPPVKAGDNVYPPLPVKAGDFENRHLYRNRAIYIVHNNICINF